MGIQFSAQKGQKGEPGPTGDPFGPSVPPEEYYQNCSTSTVIMGEPVSLSWGHRDHGRTGELIFSDGRQRLNLGSRFSLTQICVCICRVVLIRIVRVCICRVFLIRIVTFAFVD